jgi:nodulation protein A
VTAVPAEPVDWSTTWEGELDDAAGDELAALLVRCFPRARTLFVGARPEARVVGRVGGQAVAHLGILRRFLRRPDTDRSLLVGDVGLVAVDAQWRGRGVGRELLAAAARELHRLDLPFGFLTCGQRVVPFYADGGWVPVPNPIRQIGYAGRIEVLPAVSMALPVLASMDQWPTGLLDRNGLEV